MSFIDTKGCAMAISISAVRAVTSKLRRTTRKTETNNWPPPPIGVCATVITNWHTMLNIVRDQATARSNVPTTLSITSKTERTCALIRTNIEPPIPNGNAYATASIALRTVNGCARGTVNTVLIIQTSFVIVMRLYTPFGVLRNLLRLQCRSPRINYGPNARTGTTAAGCVAIPRLPSTT